MWATDYRARIEGGSGLCVQCFAAQCMHACRDRIDVVCVWWLDDVPTSLFNGISLGIDHPTDWNYSTSASFVSLCQQLGWKLLGNDYCTQRSTPFPSTISTGRSNKALTCMSTVKSIFLRNKRNQLLGINYPLVEYTATPTIFVVLWLKNIFTNFDCYYLF
jgi:hypothetical protein